MLTPTCRGMYNVHDTRRIGKRARAMIVAHFIASSLLLCVCVYCASQHVAHIEKYNLFCRCRRRRSASQIL